MALALVQAERDTKRRLMLGFALSITLHVIALTLLVAMPAATSAAARELIRPDLEEPLEPEDEVRLGDPDSSVTSFTWIGYDEYEEQFSPVPSEVDQAQLTPTPRVPLPVPTPINQSAPRPEPTPPAPVESLAARPGQNAHEPVTSSDALDEVLASLEQPPVDLPSDVAVDLTLGDGAEAAEEAEAGEPAETKPVEQETVQMVPRSGSPEDDPGDPADREASFSATLTQDDFEQGKPLSGRGLYVQTVRPRATMYSQVTRVLRSPRSPLFRVHFRGDGTVDHVEVVQTSGVRDVDRPLLDLLYRWTARGPQLESLQEGTSDETISVEIRILFRRR